MSFQWLDFLRAQKIEYISSGKNVAAHNVNIHCPFCGVRDPSMHLGLHLKSYAWGCWRDDTHRGRTPERLIARLLSCTWDQAHQLVAHDSRSTTSESWRELKKRLVEQQIDPRVSQPGEVLPDENFFTLGSDAIARTKVTKLFEDYLLARHFDDPIALADQYNLQGCLSGDFRFRLIFPFYLAGKLVGWTGRAITRAVLRYKSFPSGEQPAILYNFDAAQLTGGRVLVVVEGPIDTLKFDFYGSSLGIRAVGLLGLNLSPAKLVLLARLAERFKRVVFCLDREALAHALDFQARAAIIPGVRVVPLTTQKDPGAMRALEATRFLKALA